ncbi:MAG: H-NS histone family protein [Methylococcaceae bacterium]
MTENNQKTDAEKLHDLLEQIKNLNLTSSVIAEAETEMACFKKQARKIEVNEMKLKVEAMAASCGYSVTFQDLREKPIPATAFTEKGGKVKKTVRPKYRNPEDGATFSGRGRKSKWFKDYLDSGKPLKDIEIQYDEATGLPVSESDDKMLGGMMTKDSKSHSDDYEDHQEN